MSLRSNWKPALGQQSTLIKHVTLTSCKLEPPIWSCGTGQRIIWFNRCQLIITCQISKKYTVNQGCTSLSTYYLEDGHHLAWLHCCLRRGYAPTSNTVSRDNHEKISSWISFSFLYRYGPRLVALWAAGAPLLLWYHKLQHGYTYTLLTKHEGRTGRILALGLFCTDLAAFGPYKKDQGPIFSQDGPKQAWLRDLLHDWNCLEKTPNDRLQRHHKLQAHDFYLEQTQRLLMSDVFKKKKNKVGRKQK